MRRAVAQRVAGLLPVLLCIALAPAACAQAERDRSVEVQMSNVEYHFTDAIAAHIRRLHGYLLPRGEFPVFDDKNSFVLRLQAAEIAMTPRALANVLNSYVFAKEDAPLKAIEVTIESGRHLKIKGKLHSKGNVPFEMSGTLAATPDGKIRLHAEKIKAAHLPVKGLMDLLGLDMADLIKTGKVSGVQVEKDDVILDPATLLPPPHIVGKVVGVRLEKDNIVEVFGRSLGTMPMRVPYPNYMAYRGNRLRFGKLTMNDTDMVLIDMQPKDPFDFYLDHYREQLVAGYTKETPSFGLRVFMPDYNKLHETAKARNSQSK